MAEYQPTSGRIVSLSCIVCGAGFVYITQSKGRYARFCSDGCRAKRRIEQARANAPSYRARYKPKMIDRICVECSAPFKTPNNRTVCCGPVCGAIRGKRLGDATRSANARRRLTRSCRECGRVFTMHQPSGKGRRGLSNEGQFCSLQCAGSEKRWASYIEKRRAIRRMKKRAKFDSIDVFERDGWRCIRCGDEVPKGAANPDPSSACVNLILPASKGGKRDWNNVALTHLMCAVERRARPLRCSSMDAASPSP